MTESSSSESEEEGERGGASIYTAAYFLKKWVWLIGNGMVTYIAIHLPSVSTSTCPQR